MANVLKLTNSARTAGMAALLGIAGMLAATSGQAAPASGTPATHLGAQIAKGNNFTVSAETQGACKAGAECKVQLKLEASDPFHVNKEYPYKFKANDVAGVDYTGTDASGKNVFSKAAGDFTLDPKSEKIGYLTVHFKPSKAGALALTGTFKLSVCSAQNCQLETSELSIPVTVK
jgi:hypothetical protein